MINDSDRITALHRLRLMDTPTEASFDRLTRLAARTLHAPVSLITLVEQEHQFFKSYVGLPEPLVAQPKIPLSYTYCHQVINDHRPVSIADARQNLRNDIDLAPLNITAYAGVPLITSDSYVIGTLCVIDHQPHTWTSDDIDTLNEIAGSVMSEIQLREIAEARQALEKRLSDIELRHQQEMTRINKQLVELEQVKSDMIRVAAHDLRNPLALVMGYSELMLEEGELLAEHHHEFVTSILRSGQKMLSLIKDILALERITAAQGENYQEVVFTDLAREVFESHTESARNSQLQYSFETEDKPLATSGDLAQLREAMENLISNAIKYTPAGGDVKVQLWQQGDHLLFQVVDTGYGIPDDDQARLFQAFYRVHTDETYKIGGTGLGLHLVKNIIERHAGQVVYKSVYKQGSTFGFYLPRL